MTPAYGPQALGGFVCVSNNTRYLSATHPPADEECDRSSKCSWRFIAAAMTRTPLVGTPRLALHIPYPLFDTKGIYA
jgi:hypothetical protein